MTTLTDYTEEQLELAQNIAHARASFRFYVEWGKGWRIRPHNESWVLALQQLYDGTLLDMQGRPCQKLGILSFPRSSKSSYFRYFLEWVIGREFLRGVDPTVGYVCYADSLATKNSRDVRATIEATQNPKTHLEERYGLIFPGVRPGDSWSGNEWEIGRHNSNSADPTFKAAGASGSVLGFRFDSAIVMDDYLSKEAADSPSETERAWDKANDEVFTRGEEAPRLFGSTRWATFDIAGRLMESQDDWHWIHTPALIEEDWGFRDPVEGTPIVHYFSAWPAEVTPEDHKRRGVNVDTLLRLKDRDPRSFATQYQAVPPSTLGGGRFTGLGFCPTPIDEDCNAKRLAWDTGFKKSELNSFSATVEAKQTKSGDLVIINAYQKRYSYGELKAEAIDQHSRFEKEHPTLPLWAAVEDRASGQSLAQELPWLFPAQIKNKDLPERSSIASKFVHSGRVKVTEDWFPMKQVFLQQILNYPDVPFTDFASAFTLLIEQTFINGYLPLPKVKVEEDPDQWDFRRDWRR